jgi:hypothetical protein
MDFCIVKGLVYMVLINIVIELSTHRGVNSQNKQAETIHVMVHAEHSKPGSK